MLKLQHLNITLLSGNPLSLDFVVEDEGVNQTVFDVPFSLENNGEFSGISIEAVHHSEYAPIISDFWGVKIPEGEKAFFPISQETRQQIEDFISKLR